MFEKFAKFPPNAKVVFKGQRWKVWQWEQTRYDGSVAIYEAVSRLDTVKIIAEIDGKFAYSRQSQPHIPEPFWDVFGGVVEEGEEPLAAAKRELLEEGGLESDDLELVLAYPAHSSGQIHWDVYIYFARNCRRVGEPKPDEGEKVELLFAGPAEFVKLLPLLIYNADAREKLITKIEGKK